MSGLKAEITEKMEEARGLFSSLFSAKKGKKPRDLIDTIRSFLQQLQVQQTILAAQLAAGGAQTQVQAPTPSNAAATEGNAAATPAAAAAQAVVSPTAAGVLSPTAAAATADGADAEITPQLITADLDAISTLLYGDASADSSSSGARDPDPKSAKEVIDLMFEFDIFRRLLENIRYLEFEGRKFFTRIFEYALTQRRDLSVPYILSHRYLLMQCIHAYEEKDVSIALSCDAILRACIQCEPITEMIFTSAGQPIAADDEAVKGDASSAAAASSVAAGGSAVTPQTPSAVNADMVLQFFPYLDLPTFINSHAFASFKLLLQLFPEHSSSYLLRNYTTFFSYFNRLLVSDNYLTRVQAFQLLGELLMERSNQEMMMRYVNEADHLKISMQALRGPKAIQLAVFNVLKVFVPNPYKADSIVRILTQNKKNFLAFLDEFERDSEDEVLIAHKQEMIAALESLPDSVAPLPKKTSAGSKEDAAAQQPQRSQPPAASVPVEQGDSLP